MFGVSVGKIMSTVGESSFVFTSATPAEGVLPPPESAPRYSIPTTPLTPVSRVVQPLTSSNAAGPSSGVVVGIPNAPFASHSFMHTAHSSHIGSYSFV